MSLSLKFAEALTHPAKKTCRNYPEYTELRMRGRMPVNILTWPRLTFLARRQTLVYPRLFIKHTLLIINNHPIHLRISEIFSEQRKQSEWAEPCQAGSWRAPLL